MGYLNARDQHHAWAVECWAALFDPLWTCEAVLSEAIFVLQSEGLSTEPIVRLMERGVVHLGFSMEKHQADVFRLLRKCADQPMSLADACLARMAEVTPDCRVFTTDRDFLAYRRSGCGVIPVLAPFKKQALQSASASVALHQLQGLGLGKPPGVRKRCRRCALPTHSISAAPRPRFGRRTTRRESHCRWTLKLTRRSGARGILGSRRVFQLSSDHLSGRLVGSC